MLGFVDGSHATAPQHPNHAVARVIRKLARQNRQTRMSPAVTQSIGVGTRRSDRRREQNGCRIDFGDCFAQQTDIAVIARQVLE